MHFDFYSIDVNGFDFKIDPNGGNMSDFVFFVGISQENVGLSYCGVANDDNLDEIIVLFLLSSFSHVLLWLSLLISCENVYQLDFKTFCKTCLICKGKLRFNKFSINLAEIAF